MIKTQAKCELCGRTFYLRQKVTPSSNYRGRYCSNFCGWKHSYKNQDQVKIPGTIFK